MIYIKSFTEQGVCKLFPETKESLQICFDFTSNKAMNTIDELDFPPPDKAHRKYKSSKGRGPLLFSFGYSYKVNVSLSTSFF